jgi:transmembrane sensor
MRKTLTLADGSSIELNTDTVVRVASSDNQRRVILDKGEAFFQIKHNAERPFVVTVGSHQVTDLGTKFFVRQHFDDVEVGLVEGSARFDATIADVGKRSVTLTPGDRVFATATSFSVTRNEIPVLENDLGWRRGILIFRHTTLAEAVSEFNRYNTRKIVLDDPGVAKLEILGTFRTGDIARFARVAGTALSLRTTRRGGDIVLSK